MDSLSLGVGVLCEVVGTILPSQWFLSRDPLDSPSLTWLMPRKGLVTR